MATWCEGEVTAGLLQRTDEAMYAAKSAGGGRVVVSGAALVAEPVAAPKRRFRR